MDIYYMYITCATIEEREEKVNMTTTTYMRSSSIGEHEIKDSIAAYLGDSDMDLDEVLKDVQDWVNRELPGSYAWYPYISEVYADVDESEELTEEDLMDYIRQGIEECAIDPDEERCTSLTDAARSYIRDEICEEAGADQEDYDLDEINQLDRKLRGKAVVNLYGDRSGVATIREYKRAFKAFFGGE